MFQNSVFRVIFREEISFQLANISFTNERLYRKDDKQLYRNDDKQLYRKDDKLIYRKDDKQRVDRAIDEQHKTWLTEQTLLNIMQ